MPINTRSRSYAYADQKESFVSIGSDTNDATKPPQPKAGTFASLTNDAVREGVWKCLKISVGLWICVTAFGTALFFAFYLLETGLPTIGDTPAISQEIGREVPLANIAFVHLYWPPSPPPMQAIGQTRRVLQRATEWITNMIPSSCERCPPGWKCLAGACQRAQ